MAVTPYLQMFLPERTSTIGDTVTGLAVAMSTLDTWAKANAATSSGPQVHVSLGPSYEERQPQTIPDSVWTPIVFTEVTYDGVLVGPRPLVDFHFADEEWVWSQGPPQQVSAQPDNVNGVVGKGFYNVLIDVYWDTSVVAGIRKLHLPIAFLSTTGSEDPDVAAADTTHSGDRAMYIGETTFMAVVWQNSGDDLNVEYAEAWLQRMF